MPHRPLHIGRLTFWEPWISALNEQRVSLDGQESMPPSTDRHLQVMARDIAELEGQLVAVTFHDKSNFDGYYMARNCNSEYQKYSGAGHGGVHRLNWTIDLDRVGRPNDTLIQSLLTVVELTNDHSIDDPEAVHAPPIGATRYTPERTTLTRVGADGPVTVYRGVTDASDPKYIVAPADYYRGAVRVVDQGATRQGLGYDGGPTDLELTNGLVSLQIDPDGQLQVTHHTAVGWAAAKAWKVQINAGDVDSWGQLTVLQNRPEYAAVRLERHRADDKGAITLDLVMHRGGRSIAGLLTCSDASTLKIVRAANEAGTTFTGGVRATSNDGDGNRYVVASTLAHTADTTAGGLQVTDATLLPFIIGSEIEGSTAQAGDTAAALLEQYIGWVTEELRGIVR